MNINEFQPTSGRFVKEDGTTVNIADELGGKSVSDKVYDIDNMMPHSGRFIKEDGTTVNIADMIANGDIGGGGGSSSGSSDDSAPPIVETYNGQTIQCSMSADRPLQGLNLYATCKQQTYSGKNLFNKETTEDGLVNASGQLDSSETVKTSDFIKVKPSTQYKSSFASAYVKFYTSEKEPVQTENVDITANTQSFTTGESTEYIRYSFNFASQAPETLIIVEGTNELTPYEPYTGGIPSPNGDYPQEIQAISDFVVEVKNSMGEVATPQTLNVTIPEQGFYGIPVSEGGNYTDTDGQQWICDEFDYKRGKYIQRVRKVILNGSENERWKRYTATPSKSVFVAYRTFEGSKPAFKMSICNMFINKSRMWDADETWIYSEHNNRPEKYFNIPKVIVNTLEEWETWLSTHPLEVLYSLATPVEYDLTNEQVEQFKKLKSYYGTTYIDNDAVPACNMQAELVLDTKLYIDNKFTTLAGQILEMGV